MGRQGKSDAIELHLPPTQIVALGGVTHSDLGETIHSFLGKILTYLGETIHYDLGETLTNYDLREVTHCDQVRSPTETPRCSHFPLSPNSCYKMR